jgi:RNA polymerase sigma-70 factor (ECF subfamily)
MTNNKRVEKIIAGDRSAFEELINEYKDSVMRTCMGFVHNYTDAEDISQEVFIEIYQSIGKFRGDSKLSTWIYRITVNKSLNFIRKNKKHNVLKSIESFFTGNNDGSSSIDIADEKAETKTRIEQTETADVLAKAIDSLAKNQKIAFTLHKYDDLSYKQIAEVMELSLSSVESLIHRAKTNLQKKLINYYKAN